MFSFHKPRIYRSASGCCICRAKSSSSRFTDSRRYEGDFYACFKLSECRTGDICNACVLLVKRWKKLPKGSQRNWHHVVDARAGHGSKPMSKINKVKKPNSSIGVLSKIKQPGLELSDKMRNVMKKHIGTSDSYINSLGRVREHSPGGCSDDVQMDCISSESGSYHSSLAASPTPSEVGEDEVSFNNVSRVKKTKTSTESVHNHSLTQQSNKGISSNSGNIKPRGRDTSHKQRRNSDASHSSFLDLSFWKREKTCCGIIFKGPCGEVLLDRRFLSPCFLRSMKDNVGCKLLAKQKSVQRQNKSETSVSGTDLEEGDCSIKEPIKDIALPVDCISVDSGYDDSSNSTLDAFRPLSGSRILHINGGAKAPSSDLVSASYSCGASTVIKSPPSLQQTNISSSATAPMSTPSVVTTIQCGTVSKISTN